MNPSQGGNTMSRQVQTNFRAEDFTVASKNDKPARKRAASKPKAKAEAPQQDPNAVPDGTTEEVLAWVGDDKARAQKALDKEQKDDSPRVTLVEPLEKLVEEPETEEPEAEEPKADEKPARKRAAKKTAAADDK
jgi:hypothetical protein